MKEEMIHKELSGIIIGAAINVLNELKPGLDEKLYENALIIELQNQGHQTEQQQRFPVHYHNQLIGTLIPDLIVDNLVIVDPKVVIAFDDNHMAQMLGYLAITNLYLAILLNFKYARLQWKRVVRTQNHNSSHPRSSAPSAVQSDVVKMSKPRITRMDAD